MKRINISAGVVAAVLLSAPVSVFGSVGHDEDTPSPHEAIQLTLEIPEMSAERGKELFATKGCASCHSVNGTGGTDAVPLDAHLMDATMNPFELAAKMWAMAPYMIAAQEEELGAQILFTGQELADIAAFLHNDAEQHEFTDAYLDSLGLGKGHGSEEQAGHSN